MIKVLKEAIIVGICLIFFGYLGGGIAKMILPVPNINEYFNKYHIMELSLFIAGLLFHLTCEILGINKWYCKNGAACV